MYYIGVTIFFDSIVNGIRIFKIGYIYMSEFYIFKVNYKLIHISDCFRINWCRKSWKLKTDRQRRWASSWESKRDRRSWRSSRTRWRKAKTCWNNRHKDCLTGRSNSGDRHTYTILSEISEISGFFLFFDP